MTSKTPQILELDPPLELSFQGPFTEVVTTSLKLSNPTNERVGFKVKTTAPKQYCVRPNSGIISPHGYQVVSVMLQPMEDVSLSERAKHKFMVQSMCVDDTFTPENLDEAVSLTDILESAMRQADKKKLMDSKLKCNFIEGTSDQAASNVKTDTISASSVDSTGTDTYVSSPSVKVNEDTSSTNTTNTTTPEVSQQPTAGSTPGHNTTRQVNVESDQTESELRVLRDRTRKLTEENKTLKTETDRLRQQFLTQSTTVKNPIRSTPGGPARKGSGNESSFSFIAILLILVALIMGYFVGIYTSK